MTDFLSDRVYVLAYEQVRDELAAVKAALHNTEKELHKVQKELEEAKSHIRRLYEHPELGL